MKRKIPSLSKRFVLLIEGREQSESRSLFEGLQEMSVQTDVASSFEQAKVMLQEGQNEYGAVLIPTTAESPSCSLKELTASAPPEVISWVSYGMTPDNRERRRLRRCGVKIALWNPVESAILRFQINHALNPAGEAWNVRQNPRVPTTIRCSVAKGGRSTEALIYSLSQSGCFLETPRASMRDAEIEICLNIPDDPLTVQGKVIFANVTGNLQRPGLPLGMGVHFVNLGWSTRRALKKYVATCSGRLSV